jgi:hypothetical protein
MAAFEPGRAKMVSRICGAFPLVFLLCACSANAPEKAKVSGRVTYSGSPLKGGTIVFVHSASGHTATANISTEGHFELMADVGMNQIAVDYRGPEIDDPNPKAPKGASFLANHSSLTATPIRRPPS